MKASATGKNEERKPKNRSEQAAEKVLKFFEICRDA
jgi:hypothetical protein